MKPEQLPIIGRVILSMEEKRDRERTTRENEILSEMSGLVKVELDTNTQAKLERLTDVRPTKNVGFMAISSSLYQSKEPFYPGVQQQMGNAIGGLGFRGKIIEGVRVRFIGPTKEEIEEISFGKFVRRIPILDSSMIPYFAAYQIVAEDEDAVVYRVFSDQQALHAMQHRESNVYFSDSSSLRDNRMISWTGEKSMEPGRYGFMLNGYSVRPGSKNAQLDREYLQGIVDLVSANRTKMIDLLKHDGVINLLDKIGECL